MVKCEDDCISPSQVVKGCGNGASAAVSYGIVSLMLLKVLKIKFMSKVIKCCENVLYSTNELKSSYLQRISKISSKWSRQQKIPVLSYRRQSILGKLM